MTTNLALAQPQNDRRSEPRRPAVEIVSSRQQRRARPKLAYALIATAALFVLLLTQLGISIALSDGAYKISDLQGKQTELARDQQKYAEQLDVLSSPQNLANNAAALGMVRNSNPVYLDLSTGAVHGDPTPAVGSTDSAADNLIPNTLLDGVPLATKTPATATPAAAGSTPTDSAAAGAAGTESAGQSVASDPNQLAAPETR
ncbi:hypothetical protein ACPEEZ_06700 [Frigoribacterium sp. 2-23]|uniref:hypothetical protein n=1 Tax=Frigoribacterium sp. 2-23 TaxID=3415006 RepID=UPI003C6F4B70